MALGLEYGPRPEVMAWANQQLKTHAKRRAIIVTHGYLFYDNQRYDHRNSTNDLGGQRPCLETFCFHTIPRRIF